MISLSQAIYLQKNTGKNTIDQLAASEYPPTFMTETNSAALWAEVEKIGKQDIPKPPSLNLTPQEQTKPASPRKEAPDDSDLIEYIYEGQPKPEKDQDAIDNFFGVVTKGKVTYAKYSPWANVELSPPSNTPGAIFSKFKQPQKRGNKVLELEKRLKKQ